jgi:hypothetical protein
MQKRVLSIHPFFSTKHSHPISACRHAKSHICKNIIHHCKIRLSLGKNSVSITKNKPSKKDIPVEAIAILARIQILYSLRGISTHP